MDRKTIVFLLVSAVIFTDMMVYSLVIPVLPSYSLSPGADQLTLGIIFGAFSVALLAFSIPIGLLSDRTGRRPVMVIGILTLAAARLVMAQRKLADIRQDARSPEKCITLAGQRATRTPERPYRFATLS